MWILGTQWKDGYLDYHRAPGELRIHVLAWWPIERLRDLFQEQPRSWRRVLNYVKDVGVIATMRKVRSRMSERLRDMKVIAVGVGRVCDSDLGNANDRTVIFIAPRHPLCVERLSLPLHLTREAPDAVAAKCSEPGAILFLEQEPAGAPDWSEAAGWDASSGTPISAQAAHLLDWAAQAFSQIDSSVFRKLPLPARSVVRERSMEPTGSTTPLTSIRAERALPERSCEGEQGRDKLSAALFGFGNYAKTCILPNLDTRIQLGCIHELDSAQLGRVDSSGGARPASDTCPYPRADESYDVYFIAGYHHTHADLAILALKSGAYAVVEKPLVTTREQLDHLLAILSAHPGRFFGCFHMRYDEVWEKAKEDLALSTGQPVHSHCIVYEVPLVRRHWYNWPVSGSRIISNGCHWLDHFLFMNNFACPVRHDLWRGRNGDFHVSVELENGAVFGMALTDIGGKRIGVQDHIELRAGEVTVRVQNGDRYCSENHSRVIRRTRFDRMANYKKMYQNISYGIATGGQGDSIESIQRSCQLMLDLEEQAQAQISATRRAMRSVASESCPQGAGS